jgi:hypothetical protein
MMRNNGSSDYTENMGDLPALIKKMLQALDQPVRGM